MLLYQVHLLYSVILYMYRGVVFLAATRIFEPSLISPLFLSLSSFFHSGLVFPEYFYTFLHDYFKSFTTATQLTPDQCIKKYIKIIIIIFIIIIIIIRLYSDIEAILANLFLNSTKQDRETGYGGMAIDIHVHVHV